MCKSMSQYNEYNIYIYTRICARKYNIDRLDWIGLDWIRLYEIDQIRSD